MAERSSDAGTHRETWERRFGRDGQEAVYGALREVGLDVGRQILADAELPDDLTEAEFISFYATIVNRFAYASLEDPRIDGEDQAPTGLVVVLRRSKVSAKPTAEHLRRSRVSDRRASRRCSSVTERVGSGLIEAPIVHRADAYSPSGRSLAHHQRPGIGLVEAGCRSSVSDRRGSAWSSKVTE